MIRAKWESLAIFFRETVLCVAGKISDACWSAQSHEEVFVMIDTEMRELLATLSTGGDFDDAFGCDAAPVAYLATIMTELCKGSLAV